jgi:hypothetical protein
MLTCKYKTSGLLKNCLTKTDSFFTLFILTSQFLQKEFNLIHKAYADYLNN